MRNAEEIYSAERQLPELFEQELPFSRVSANDGAVAAKTSRQRSLKRSAAQEWTVAVLYALLDVTAWIILYGIITYVRGDTFYETRMGFHCRPVQLV
jgi:hypothetical protein